MQPPPRPDLDKPTPVDWVKAHKLVSAVVVVVVLSTIGALASDDTSTNNAGVLGAIGQSASPQDASPSPSPSPSDEPAPTPKPVVETATVPPVEGLTFQKARDHLQAAGFVISTRMKYSKAQAGTVLSLEPGDGADLEVGSVVQLVLAEEFPKVPSVIGLGAAKAGTALKAAGYKISVTKQVSSQAVGTVIATNPGVGTQLLPGKSVTLVIAKAAPAPKPSCDSNYSGYCVPIVSYDLNCDDVGSYFKVVGYDKHGFDGDGDGIACES